VSRLLLALGVILILGGLGHFAGIIHLYITQGVPEVNRVLLDAWVGEAQVIAGGLYLASFRAMRAGSAWRNLSVAGALVILAYAVPFIPVLLVRAPMMFRIPPIVYAFLSAFILFRVARPTQRGSSVHADRHASVV
jgi:hypothetical protein